jgi:hypothetical protein
MTGFKVVIKAVAHGFNIDKLKKAMKFAVESSDNDIVIQHIQAKGTTVMGMVDPIQLLNNTIDRRNASLYRAECQINENEQLIGKLEYQVEELLLIIRERENSNNNDDCSCNDWRSIGTDPETGDKLKRCNICERVGVR